MQFIIEYGNVIISVIAGIGAAALALKIGPVILNVVTVFQQANLQVALLSAQFGAAQVSAVALGGGLSLAEIAVSLFTGKITLATAATSALTTVMNANPIFLIASVIGVVVTVLGTFITQIIKSKNAVEEAAEETNEYAEAMNKVKEAGQENIDNANREIGVIKEKAKRYEELRERYNNLTRGEMAEFKSLCEELQQILPEGTSLIDEQTGAYNSLADSIDNVCKKMELNAVLNAKYDEFAEAAAQKSDVQKQIDEVNKRYTSQMDDQNLLDMYSAEGISVPTMNDIAMQLYGLSYDDLVKTRDENQKIIDEYHQLYEDTYNEINPSETTYYDTAAEQHRIAATEYADKIIEENSKALKRKERETQKLQDGFKELDHLYAIGEISDEKELYNNKLALWNEYGDKSNQEHWQYYEELHSYEKKFAEESEKEEKERLEKLKDLNEETAEALLDIERERYKKQLSITTTGINSLLSEYKKKMGELESNISSYKAKLLSVGDIFSITESTDENGKKTRKYTVENIREQMNEMRKYHNYVKQLKASGASEGLLSELTSMDFADGAQFGKYLTSMSSAEFKQINELYKERDALADELSQDLYAGEAEKINNALISAVDTALLQLPEQAQAAGRQFLSDFISGLDLSTEDISDEISNFVSGFTEIYNSSLDDLDLEHKFTVTLGGMNTYAMGQDLARQLTAGFNDEIERSVPEIKLGQVNAGVQLSGNANKGTTSLPKNSNTTETVIFENTNHITVELDGEKITEKTEKRIAEKKRRTG